jgi:hypothetical protein
MEIEQVTFLQDDDDLDVLDQHDFHAACFGELAYKND